MNAQMMKKNVKATVSATYFTYDHINKKIDGTMENFELSGIPGSAQDLALMACRKEHPDYDFRIVKLKKEKRSYKGLTRELMYDYIDCFGTDEMMKHFETMKNENSSFGSMKSWFLGQFPVISAERAKKEIQQYRLDMFKEKYKVTVRPSSKNRKPGSNISELPKASGND